MNEMNLIHSFKAMLMVAREYGLDIDEKYESLENHLIQEYDLDVEDMMSSLEKVYQLLKEKN